MTDQENRFFALTKTYESLKEQMKIVRERLDSVMVEMGTETYHQDPETMAVYKIEVPKGTFIEYKTVGYVRTVLPGEKRGSLSKTEAESLGFSLTK